MVDVNKPTVPISWSHSAKDVLQSLSLEQFVEYKLGGQLNKQFAMYDRWLAFVVVFEPLCCVNHHTDKFVCQTC